MTRRAILLLLALLAGAAMAIAAMPFLVPRLQNDSSALCSIAASLHRASPRVAVFGNSTGQEAIDGTIIGGENFCSSAQTLAESLFLQQELPASTRTIVQVVASWQLERETPFEPDHLTMLKMCGWRVQRPTRAAFARAFGEAWASEVDSHALRDRFAARTHVRAALEIFIRERLSPARASRRSAAPDERPGESETPPRLQNGQMRILGEAAAAAKRDGRRYVVVLAPLRRPNRAFVAAMRGIASEVVDLTELLAPEEFRDATHASAAGRRKVSEAVAARLR